MRRLLLLVAVAATVLLVDPASAQTTLGVRGGVSVASASLDSDTFDESNRTGFVGGAFLDFGGSSLFGFQIGAQYAQKGTEFDAGAAVDELALDYLEIPAVVKVGLPLGSLKPSIFAGAALGFNSNCEEAGGSVEVCDDFSDTEFSGVVGADLAIYLGGLSLWADARYNVGLGDIADGDAFGDFSNRAFNLTAGLGFRLGN